MQVGLSSSETSSSRALQNQRGKGIGSVSGTEMAQSAMVPRTGGDAGSPLVDYPTEERPIQLFEMFNNGTAFSFVWLIRPLSEIYLRIIPFVCSL